MTATDTVRRAAREHPLDWLLMMLASWVIPLGLLGPWGTTYRWSLVLWAVPIVCLLPRIVSRTRNSPETRRALKLTVLYIFIGGCILDLVFGFLILCFDCVPGTYWFFVPAVKTRIPIEEILFYLLGGYAVTFIYLWADRYWLERYHVDGETAKTDATPLMSLSSVGVTWGVALLVAGLLTARVVQGRWAFPTYFVFLDLVAFAPAIAIYRKVNRYVNWRAFSFTALYVMLTACIWEVTLALPRRWWGYQAGAMIGVRIPPWTTPMKECIRDCAGFGVYPIEALFVWIAVSFSAALLFEALRVYHHDPRRPGERLFGLIAPNAPSQAPPERRQEENTQ